MSTSGVPARLASLLSATACVSAEFGIYWCVCARATACHSRTGRVRADEDSPALASVRRARQWPKTVKSFEGIEAARNDFRLSHFWLKGGPWCPPPHCTTTTGALLGRDDNGTLSMVTHCISAQHSGEYSRMGERAPPLLPRLMGSRTSRPSALCSDRGLDNVTRPRQFRTTQLRVHHAAHFQSRGAGSASHTLLCGNSHCRLGHPRFLPVSLSWFVTGVVFCECAPRARMHVRSCTCGLARVLAYARACACVRARACPRARTCDVRRARLRVCVCMCVCVYVCVCVCVCVWTTRRD